MNFLLPGTGPVVILFGFVGSAGSRKADNSLGRKGVELSIHKKLIMKNNFFTLV